MKTGIHPKYNTIKVSCSCGETWESGSTVKVQGCMWGAGMRVWRLSLNW